MKNQYTLGQLVRFGGLIYRIDYVGDGLVNGMYTLEHPFLGYAKSTSMSVFDHEISPLF